MTETNGSLSKVSNKTIRPLLQPLLIIAFDKIWR